jgi:predicted ATPase
MLLRSITLKNLLSFKDSTLELRPLNVLIGANGSGKSNLIDAISLLQGAPRNLASAMERGDGVQGWINKGFLKLSSTIACELQDDDSGLPFRYTLQFGERGHALVIFNESLVLTSGGSESLVFDRVEHTFALGKACKPSLFPDEGEQVKLHDSLLSGGGFLDLAFRPARAIAKWFSAIRIYRELNTSLPSRIRRGSTTDAINDFLVEDGSNLALVLSRLNLEAGLDEINRRLHRFSELAHELVIGVHGGVAQVYVREQGVSEPIPATRLSDGTLKFLCLLTILLHPEPPGLICIEEPEVGLHPDAIQILGEVLVEASERTQLIVTTHSEALVDALSPAPESVVICDRDFDGSTQFQRLSREKLDAWLEHYTLGDLWKKGEIGGNRW